MKSIGDFLIPNYQRQGSKAGGILRSETNKGVLRSETNKGLMRTATSKDVKFAVADSSISSIGKEPENIY